MRRSWIRTLFVIAGAYDGLLGLAFLFFPVSLFQWYGVTLPNHLGYVRFPALLLILFGVMFFQVAKDPDRFRCLMPYGIGLKTAYCGTVFGYALTKGIPGMWLPWAWADLVFLVLFLLAWRSTASAPARATA
ncbi:MAG: hypothetical protein OES32_18395 [Acidobacteriota bacterium]|nr:hypothetical protein [Acidobacteriota bacterium]